MVIAVNVHGAAMLKLGRQPQACRAQHIALRAAVSVHRDTKVRSMKFEWIESRCRSNAPGSYPSQLPTPVRLQHATIKLHWVGQPRMHEHKYHGCLVCCQSGARQQRIPLAVSLGNRAHPRSLLHSPGKRCHCFRPSQKVL